MHTKSKNTVSMQRTLADHLLSINWNLYISCCTVKNSLSYLMNAFRQAQVTASGMSGKNCKQS